MVEYILISIKLILHGNKMTLPTVEDTLRSNYKRKKRVAQVLP